MKRCKSPEKKLKICEFGQKSLYRVGGIELVVYELSTRMAKLGYDVTCINRSGDQSFGYEEAKGRPVNINGVKIMYAPTINKRGFAAMTSSIAASFMAAFGNYDVVHIHAEGPAFMCWLPKMLGKRVIVTIHGLDHKRAKWGKLASWYIRTGEKNAVKFADEIIVLSKGVQKYFDNTYGRKTVFIPNGVTKPVCREANLIKTKWNLTSNEYILSLSRLCPEKGCQYLIKAFRHVKTNKRLVIAGGSSDTDDFVKRLKTLAKGDDRIIFTGFVSGEILDEIYSNAYIYCLPSDLEGMPLSLLEAMSYGNCCLTSNIQECVEVIEDKAITFEKSNEIDLSKKIDWLVKNREIVENYKKEATDFICTKYSWDNVVEKTLKIYNG